MAVEVEGATVDKSSFLDFLASSLKKMSTARSRKESIFLSADCIVISLLQMGQVARFPRNVVAFIVDSDFFFHLLTQSRQKMWPQPRPVALTSSSLQTAHWK